MPIQPNFSNVHLMDKLQETAAVFQDYLDARDTPQIGEISPILDIHEESLSIELKQLPPGERKIYRAAASITKIQVIFSTYARAAREKKEIDQKLRDTKHLFKQVTEDIAKRSDFKLACAIICVQLFDLKTEAEKSLDLFKAEMIDLLLSLKEEDS